uniref:Beta-1,3-glucuronyltransferase 1 (glucuronosyltransferase P) b n=1 Tax=Neolamprologus brichardi TaxID=32507 RepID=A0A3Q4HVM7_NEOBR
QHVSTEEHELACFLCLCSWLLQDSGMRLRTTHPGFIQAVNTFFDKLIPKLVPLQFKKGGPIIAVQVENEYGSFAKDQSYILFIKEALQSRGISELLLTSDEHKALKSGGVDGGILIITHLNINMHTHITYVFKKMSQKSFGIQNLYLHESITLNTVNTSHFLSDMVSTVREILRRGMSVNLYMFHGGSSFGFMSGALANPSYRALVPSYDYDAPLSESGEYTSKYHLLRDLLSRYKNSSDSLPDMPVLHYREAYEPAIMYQHLSLWDALIQLFQLSLQPFKSAKPVNMENLPVNSRNGQSYGYTLYETIIRRGGLLQSGDNVRDRALVFVDRSYIGLFKRQSLELGRRTLSLLVENCGRVHQGRELDKQRKGLVGDILLNNIPLRDFTIYSLDMKPSFIDRFVIVFEEQEGDFKVHFEDEADLGMAADIQ